jgi:hypothetical protein
MSRHLFHFEEFRKSTLPPSLGLGSVHGLPKVIDKFRVDVEDETFGEGGHKDVPNLLITVPFPNVLGKGNPEERVTLEDFRNTVEDGRDF